MIFPWYTTGAIYIFTATPGDFESGVFDEIEINLIVKCLSNCWEARGDLNAIFLLSDKKQKRISALSRYVSIKYDSFTKNANGNIYFVTMFLEFN